MAGLALALDLLHATASTAKSLHSSSSLSAVSAAFSASLGVTFLPSYPAYSPQFRSWDWIGACVICEAGQDIEESWALEDSRWLPQLELTKSAENQKEYNFEVKPLFAAFRPRALAATTVRACLVNFLPFLEAYVQPEEDEFEEDADRPASIPVDPIVPVKGCGMHILREVSVSTTRRLLERATVHYVSPRIAWKLLKDVPKSAIRKAGRETSKWHLCVGVTKTTLTGHALGVVANWVVQMVLDIYRYVRCTIQKKDPETREGRNGRKQEKKDMAMDFNMLMRKTAGNSLKSGASLVLASVGAGLGTIIIKPSTGTWIGCAAGDAAGQYLIGMLLDAWIFYGTFSPPGQNP